MKIEAPQFEFGVHWPRITQGEFSFVEDLRPMSEVRAYPWLLSWWVAVLYVLNWEPGPDPEPFKLPPLPHFSRYNADDVARHKRIAREVLGF